jgi:hypothetical protein
VKYALLIYEDEATMPSSGSPEGQDLYQKYLSFTKDISEEGINRAGEALHGTDTATSVRVRGGEVSVTDGPFAETKEQLGGFYLIEVDDLDKAIGVASRVPAAQTGSVEIRPLVEWV